MKRLITLILSAITILSCLGVTACGEKEPAQLTVLKDGVASYAIYRPDKAEDGEKEGGAELRTLIKDKTGIRFEYATDDSFSKIEGLNDIVIGNTNREASKLAAQGLGENQFRFLVVGQTIAIAASNPDCLTAAARTFVDEYVTKDGISVPDNLDRKWQCTQSFDSYEVSNPINEEGDDPYVVEKDGVYYYCWSGGGGVKVSKADSLDKISKEGGKQVYTAPSGTMYSKEYWAPELHYIQGEWYIYVAADDGDDANHRMHVLKCTTQDPTDRFEYVGKISDTTDMWAIDGTVLQHKGELYFIWSGWPRENCPGTQYLYIAHMSDPCTIDSKKVLISSPSNSWEGPLNEGPIPVYHGDDVYILFSGNGSWTDSYCVGYLKLNEGADPLKAKSWTKNSSPILQRNNVAKGPGHCSVVNAIDGSYWMIYHANLPEAETGWAGRSVWIQEIQFTDKGLIKVMKNSKTVNYPYSTWVVEKEL